MFQILLIIIYVSFISLGLPDALLGSAWPSMYQEFGVSISSAGIVSTIIAGCTILSSLFCDRLIRKFGTGKITAVSVGMTAAALFGFSITKSFLPLCFWAIPYGLGAGSVDAALNNFVALHYKARHMSWLHCFWGIGATLGPFIMGACLTGNLGWNLGYRSISYVQIVLTAILVFTLPLWKKTKEETEALHETMPPLTIRKMLSLKGARQTLIAFFCYCSLEMVTGLWGSSYMVMKNGIPPEQAASLISIFYFGITGGRFLSGFLTMKLDDKNMIRLGQSFVIFGIIMLLLSPNTFIMGLGFLLTGLGCAPIYPCLLHQTPERFGKDTSQSMMGLQMACAYVGTTLTPPIVGFVMENAGVSFYPAFLLLFVALMLTMLESCRKMLR